MSKMKLLEKSMTYDEVLEYLKKHPMWELTTSGYDIGTNEYYWVKGDVIVDKDGIQRAPISNGKLCHINFKQRVLLKRKVKNEVNNLFNIELKRDDILDYRLNLNHPNIYSKEELKLAIEYYKSMGSVNINTYKELMLVYESMLDNDYVKVKFKKEEK